MVELVMLLAGMMYIGIEFIVKGLFTIGIKLGGIYIVSLMVYTLVTMIIEKKAKRNIIE